MSNGAVESMGVRIRDLFIDSIDPGLVLDSRGGVGLPDKFHVRLGGGTAIYALLKVPRKETSLICVYLIL